MKEFAVDPLAEKPLTEEEEYKDANERHWNREITKIQMEAQRKEKEIMAAFSRGGNDYLQQHPEYDPEHICMAVSQQVKNALAELDTVTQQTIAYLQAKRRQIDEAIHWHCLPELR